MICVVDARVAVKWFVDADWALREDHVELALATSDAVLVTADRRYFDKARHLGQIVWLPDFSRA